MTNEDTPDSTYHAAQVTTPGGPEALQWVALPRVPPGDDDVVVRHEAAGVNYHDVYVRSGAYSTMTVPGVPGIEAAGVVEKVGADVASVRPGDRVAWMSRSYGAYATHKVLPADALVALPSEVDARVAAASLLKSATADMLVTRCYPVQPGTRVLVHAAAGGVGQILVQMCRRLGAHVIGSVGTEEKAELARARGCEDVVLYRSEDLAARVAQLTGGRGVDVVYDGIGADTWDASLDCCAPFGHVVFFGQASGPVPPIDVARLFKRSLGISRPSVFQHVAGREAYQAALTRVLGLIASGEIVLAPPTEFAMRDAAKAHAALESGRTTGSVILTAD